MHGDDKLDAAVSQPSLGRMAQALRADRACADLALARI